MEGLRCHGCRRQNHRLGFAEEVFPQEWTELYRGCRDCKIPLAAASATTGLDPTHELGSVGAWGQTQAKGMLGGLEAAFRSRQIKEAPFQRGCEIVFSFKPTAKRVQLPDQLSEPSQHGLQLGSDAVVGYRFKVFLMPNTEGFSSAPRLHPWFQFVEEERKGGPKPVYAGANSFLESGTQRSGSLHGRATKDIVDSSQDSLSPSF